MSIGEVHRPEQRAKPLLLAELHRAESTSRSDDVDIRIRKIRRRYFRVSHRGHIIMNFNRSAADAAPSMWLFKMAPRVVDHVPVLSFLGMLFDVIRQQSLGEISVLKFFVVGLCHDL